MNSSALQIMPDDPLPLAGPLTFTVPLADLNEFSLVPAARRNEVSVLLPLLLRVHAQLGARSLQAACATVAATSKHLMRGLSTVSLRRKYEAYAAGGDWRSLVKGYKGPNKQPADFQLELKRVSQTNQCSVGEALERVRERWAAGESIPGYGTWIEQYQRDFPLRPLPKVWPRGYFPTGWSPRNLRRYGSSRGARVLHLRGLAAAKRHFPSVRRDPSLLRPLELIVIDDFELDKLCSFPGDESHKPAVATVAGLLAMCVGTRRKLHWGLGQRLERTEVLADGSTKTIRTGIARIDVQLLICEVFRKFGLPDYPVTILCENAAAAISPELELSISTLFGGRVRVERTGLINHRSLANGFVERGGKPWEKGWIEATFRQLWNILGAVKGHKGSIQRLNAPGDLESKIKYTKLLLGHGEKSLNLPSDKIAQLRLPFASPQELEEAFAWACALSDERTNHKYIGFAQVTEYLIEEGTEPQPFAALALLTEEQQKQVVPIERAESSVERWARLAATAHFTPIDPAVLAVFLLTPKRLTYKDSAISFKHDRRGKVTGFTYVDRTGEVLAGVAEGTEFLGYFNPAAPEVLHITQLNGARTGTLHRLGGKTGMAPINDRAALAEAAAIQATLINRALAENRVLHAAEDAQLAADRAHNDAIVAAHQAETAGLTVPQKIALAAGEHEAARYEAKQQARRDEAAAAKQQEKDDALVASLSPEETAALLGGNAPTASQSTAPASTEGVSMTDFLKQKK